MSRGSSGPCHAKKELARLLSFLTGHGLTVSKNTGVSSYPLGTVPTDSNCVYCRLVACRMPIHLLPHQAQAGQNRDIRVLTYAAPVWYTDAPNAALPISCGPLDRRAERRDTLLRRSVRPESAADLGLRAAADWTGASTSKVAWPLGELRD